MVVFQILVSFLSMTVCSIKSHNYTLPAILLLNMSSQFQHSSSWVYLSDSRYSNNVKCKIDFPQMFTKNVEYNTVCIYSSGVKCLHLNKNNPRFFKCSVKSNWLSTLNIYLLIKSDVSGFLASLILINLAFSSKCLSLKLMRAHMENIFRV